VDKQIPKAVAICNRPLDPAARSAGSQPRRRLAHTRRAGYAIDLVLARTGGKTRAAKVLGIDRRTLSRISRPRARRAASGGQPS
jgi:hypothetical protein